MSRATLLELHRISSLHGNPAIHRAGKTAIWDTKRETPEQAARLPPKPHLQAFPKIGTGMDFANAWQNSPVLPSIGKTGPGRAGLRFCVTGRGGFL
jgi:hypothetical protein